MSVYAIDPLEDARWPALSERHPLASVFHCRSWLLALKLTYGYEPVVYTTTPVGLPLQNGWVFCRIHSWLTGCRLVSLPFSDHCDPLVESEEDLEHIAEQLVLDRGQNHWRYIESRFAAAPGIPKDFGKHEQFCLHVLNLEPNLEQLFRALHESSTQRKIRRAEREQLTCEEGNTPALLEHGYRLLALTRRRHRVPPQPRKWFSNLAHCFGDDLNIRIAFLGQKPIASIITIRFKDKLVYKYGGADERFFALGGMQMLFWRAIQDAKNNGLRTFDLGRSDLNAQGLLVMKDRLGAARSILSYFRNPVPTAARAADHGSGHNRKQLLSYIPGRVVEFGGRLLYRHFG